MDRIFNNDRLVAAGPQGDNRDRHLHHLRQKLEIALSLSGQLLQGAAG